MVLFSPRPSIFLDPPFTPLSVAPGFRIGKLDPPIRAEQKTAILIRGAMKLKIPRRSEMNRWQRDTILAGDHVNP